MYGGTKTEMERLIKDAEKLDKSFKAQRDGNGKLTLSFADVVNGIHIVQQNLGITGTSAEEAGTTIQGSMASVKAAWKDTLTAIGSGKDIDKKLDNFTRSVKKYGDNMKPVIKQALSGAVKVIGELAPDVAAELPKLVTELAPDVLKAGADIVTNLATGVLNELDRSNFDKTAGKLTEKVNKIIDGFDAEKSGERFSGVINKFINAGFNIASTFDFKKAAEKMTTWLNKAVGNLDTAKLGATVSHVWKGVWDFIGTALEEVDWEDVGAKISEFINNIDWAGILDSMFKAIGGIIKAMPELLKGVIKNLDFESAANAMAVLFAPKAATKLFNFFKTDSATKKTLEDAGGEAGGKVSGGLLGKFTNAGSGIVSKISSGLKIAGTLAEAFSIGWAIGTEIKKGLDAIGIGQWIDEQVKKITDIFTAEEKKKAADAEEKANIQKALARFKKHGINWVSEEDARLGFNSDAYKRAMELVNLMDRYPQLAKAGYTATYLANLKAYDPEKYARLQRGDLSAVGIKPATPTTYKPKTAAEQLENQRIEEEIRRIRANWRGGGMPDEATLRKMAMGNLGMLSSTLNGAMSATNIYLDTGKLVGGTSRTSATQNNYAMRGYAT
jgi:hypothetical protein